MKALVYQGPRRISLKECPIPTVSKPTEVIVKMIKTTICGTDLHILKGDVLTCRPERILKHEGIGVVEIIGSSVTAFCENIIAAGGTIANIGVHGVKVDLHLEKLWSHNITITTRLVNTTSTPPLLKTV